MKVRKYRWWRIQRCYWIVKNKIAKIIEFYKKIEITIIRKQKLEYLLKTLRMRDAKIRNLNKRIIQLTNTKMY